MAAVVLLVSVVDINEGSKATDGTDNYGSNASRVVLQAVGYRTPRL